MARKKLEGGVIVRLLYCTLAAWFWTVANADVYMVMFKKQGLSELYSTMGVGTMDASTQHDHLLDSWLGIASTGYRKIHDYSSVFSGVAVEMTESQAELLRANGAVWRVERDARMVISTTHTPDYMAMPTGAWNKSGGVSNAGEDVVIGVVDTGIYPDHPSFSANSSSGKPYAPLASFTAPCGTDARVPGGFCNGKIVGAQQFFATAIQAGNVSVQDVSSPLDGNGHGTHCAGTAAGNNGVPVFVNGQDFGFASGIAPRARISVYKALNEQGQGFTSDIIAAIDKAVADGVQVLSLSLGPEEPSVGVVTYTDTFMEACLGAIQKGVFVAHAAGNSGPGVSTISSWSPWVTSVGATTTDRTYVGYLITADGRNFSGTGLSPGTAGATNYPLIIASDAVKAGSVPDSDFDCSDASILDAALIKGKLLVCSWNTLTVTGPAASNASYTAAIATGAVGVVLVTSIQFTTTLPPSYWNFQDLPAIVITGPTSYQAFQSYYAAAKLNSVGPTGRLTGHTAQFSGLPPKIATFSARGPDFSIGLDMPDPLNEPIADVLKPNIVAPGVDIWAAWTPLATSQSALFRGENWAMISGTSMATPHIAGVAAIVRQMYPMWSPSAIASAMETTARALDTNGAPLVAYDYQYDPNGSPLAQISRPGNAFDFGSGFVDATRSLDPGLIFDASYNDYVTFLCAEQATVGAITTVTCPANPGVASDLNLPSITIGKLVKSRVVPRTVTNVGPAETYNATITKLTGVDVAIDPPSFTIAAGLTQLLTITLTATNASYYVNQTSFGAINLVGSLGHNVRVPITVTYKQL
jgi:subtilisin family serine protease